VNAKPCVLYNIDMKVPFFFWLEGWKLFEVFKKER